VSAAPKPSTRTILHRPRAVGAALALLALATFPTPSPADDPALEAGHFLIASRSMGDPRFAHTVILVVAHGARGALGLVVNRPTGMTLAGALPGMDGSERADDPLWFGGPVEPGRAAVLVEAAQAPQPSRTVIAGLHYSTAAPVLQALTAPGNGQRFRVYAGYAGWAPGQLEGELARGDWTLAPASVKEVFSDEGMEVWRRLTGAKGTWVRRGHETPSVVLPSHLDSDDAAVALQPHRDQHRLAAHAAVLDVLHVPRGAVQGEIHARPAEGAGG
jgi:putative transcriptional regulator